MRRGSLQICSVLGKTGEIFVMTRDRGAALSCGADMQGWRWRHAVGKAPSLEKYIFGRRGLYSSHQARVLIPRGRFADTLRITTKYSRLLLSLVFHMRYNVRIRCAKTTLFARRMLLGQAMRYWDVRYRQESDSVAAWISTTMSKFCREELSLTGSHVLRDRPGQKYRTSKRMSASFTNMELALPIGTMVHVEMQSCNGSKPTDTGHAGKNVRVWIRSPRCMPDRTQQRAHLGADPENFWLCGRCPTSSQR
jgi:hypothetical protein